jgi:hypothetical protein
MKITVKRGKINAPTKVIQLYGVINLDWFEYFVKVPSFKFTCGAYLTTYFGIDFCGPHFLRLKQAEQNLRFYVS